MVLYPLLCWSYAIFPSMKSDKTSDEGYFPANSYN